jgi:hypothetical protein
MARDRLALSDDGGNEPQRTGPLQWIFLLGAFTVCTFAVYHAFPEGTPRAAVTNDASVPEPDTIRVSSNKDMG